LTSFTTLILLFYKYTFSFYNLLFSFNVNIFILQIKKLAEENRKSKLLTIEVLKKKERERVAIERKKEREEIRKQIKKEKKHHKHIKGSNEQDTEDADQRNKDQKNRDRNLSAQTSPYVLEMKKIEKEMTELIKKTKRDCKPSYELHGHCDLVYCAEFNPNRHRIVSASHDMSLRVWQIIPTVPDTLTLPPSTSQLLVHTIRLSWRAPSENGYPITNYVVQIKREDETAWIHTRNLGMCKLDKQFYRDQSREIIINQLRSGT
jgi:hypothetical protein